MWPRWGKTPRRNPPLASESPFAFSTFKDVLHLCKDEDDSQPPKKVSSIFRRVRIAAATLRRWNSLPQNDADEVAGTLAGSEKRIVVYFTSLRVVRKTFEDCSAVRSILKGFRVSIDERDLVMDAGFLEELKGLLGRRKLTLPRVFIGGRYIGGADEIRQLHETGELKKIIQGFPLAEPGVCEGCGGLRFVLCYTCNGSHKLYFEKGGFRSCTICNENGLIRCPACCS